MMTECSNTNPNALCCMCFQNSRLSVVSHLWWAKEERRRDEDETHLLCMTKVIVTSCTPLLLRGGTRPSSKVLLVRVPRGTTHSSSERPLKEF